ncbi:FAD:protein FMN transferase [Luteolibacter sp. LG18]|nr:FAD:protein FMN transferase [Luteolibacter sp. LG18]
MGTRFAITTHGPDEVKAKEAAADAFAKAEEINAVASDYIADSEVLSLSKAPPGQATVASPLLFDLLVKARHAADLTEGRFDPTIGPLTKLWRETRRRGQLPDADTLAKARAACDWHALKLDPATRGVTLEKPGMRLDLGGIAKGYAADAMFTLLRDRGFPRTCVAAGGDLRLGDPPPGETGWKVGIRSLEKDKLSDEIPLANCGVSTSGDLQQFVEISGVRYSHIIDPATGLGMTRHLAVTIVAKDTTTSDSLDNAACLAEPDQAEALEKSWGAIRVIVTTPPPIPSPAPAGR